jgi:glycosyltransferase involved in cell wall biosynthesis
LINNSVLWTIGQQKQNCASSKPQSNARFFIVGDGEELTDIQKKAALLGLSVSYKQPNPNADVVITSWRRDTDVIYAGLDIVTLTSLNEGTPVTLIEAQAAGVPIVTTDVGGVKDVVCDQTAMVATAGDLEHLTNSVLMLANSTELRQDMAMHGWPRVRNHFHYQRLANDVSALYRQLLSVKQQ